MREVLTEIIAELDKEIPLTERGLAALRVKRDAAKEALVSIEPAIREVEEMPLPRLYLIAVLTDERVRRLYRERGDSSVPPGAIEGAYRDLISKALDAWREETK